MGKARICAIFYNNPDQYPPIINSTRLFAKDGFDINIFCRENGQDWRVSYPPQAHVHRLDTRGGSSWGEYAAFVRRVLREAGRGADLFVGHDMHGLLPARLLATRYRKPLVYHCHDFADPSAALSLGGRLVRAFQQRFARTADLVIVPDAERAALMSTALRLKRPPVIVANAPLQTPPSPGGELGELLRSGGKQLERIVLRQGRIGEGHALEATLRSLPMWASRQWGFVVMGVGAAEYKERLLLLAGELGVQGQFAILPPVGYDEVAAFTSGAHVGHALYDPIHVNNVYITTASNKLMEYMAAGIPSLVSDTPAMRAFVGKYGCGLAADERSPASIAGAVNTLLGNPEAASGLGEAGRRAFLQVFSYDRQFAPVLAAFRVMSKRKT